MLVTEPAGPGSTRVLKRAMVVGGAGFIGLHLVRELIDAGVDVTSVDRDPRGRLAGTGADSVQADVASGDHNLAQQVGDGRFDAIFMASGTGVVPRSLDNPEADLQNNVGTVIAVLEAIRQRRPDVVPLLVYLSSVAVYGEAREVPISEEHSTDPLSPYGVSKLAAERYLRLYHVLHTFPTVSLRLFSVFGPGQRKLVIYDLATRLLAGENPLVINGSAEVTRDYVYVADVARCARQIAVLSQAQGEAYNVCSGAGTTLGDLAERLRDLCAPSTEIRFTGTIRPGDPVRFVGDPARSAALGASCRSDLDTGLRATVDWLRQAPGTTGRS